MPRAQADRKRGRPSNAAPRRSPAAKRPARNRRSTGRGWTVENPDEPVRVRPRPAGADVGDADELLPVGRQAKDIATGTVEGNAATRGGQRDRARARRAGLGFRDD